MDQLIEPLIFTDEQWDKIKIMKEQNSLAHNAVLDLLRVRNSNCKNQEAANVLDVLILGFVNTPLVSDPFLTPMPISKPSMTYVGDKEQGIMDVQCFAAEGYNYSVWATDDFWARWEFLRSGSLLVGYSATPPPIHIRLDLEGMGVNMITE